MRARRRRNIADVVLGADPWSVAGVVADRCDLGERPRAVS